MITVVKGAKKFQFQNSELASIDAVYDGVFIKFADQTEVKFNFSVKNGLSTVLDIVTRCNQDVTVNMDEAAIGNLSKVVVIGTPIAASHVKTLTSSDGAVKTAQAVKHEPVAISPEDIINKLTGCIK